METPLFLGKTKATILASKAQTLLLEISMLAKEYEAANESSEPLVILKSAQYSAILAFEKLKEAKDILWD